MGACRAGASGSRRERPLSEACPPRLPRRYLRRHQGVWGGVRWRQEGLGWWAPGQRNALGAARRGVSQVSTVAPGIQRNRWQDWGLPALGRRQRIPGAQEPAPWACPRPFSSRDHTHSHSPSALGLCPDTACAANSLPWTWSEKADSHGSSRPH